MSSFFTSSKVFSAAILLRTVLLFYGLFQDAYSPLKYTDIDYFVFTDAARYVSQGLSPYERETYRYTPLLAWILLPTAWPGTAWFSFGKVLFALSDIVAGWLLLLILQSPAGGSMSTERSLKFASIWLLNPMVATISTRGSSEGLLGVMVIALVWAVLNDHVAFSGFLLGLAVHFKIYPFIYGVSILWYLATPPSFPSSAREQNAITIPATATEIFTLLTSFLNRSRRLFLLTSLCTFTALNTLMYTIYSLPFLQHTYLYHLQRTDHRHNFSPYNTLLHLASARPDLLTPTFTFSLSLSRLAFVPQLLLSALLLPLALAKKDLPATMLAQTFAFVTFNKVVTSQYFLWYLCLLPLHLPRSSLLRKPWKGMLAAALWTAAQAAWLWEAYRLEYWGISTFVPGLFASALGFFGVNCWILGGMVEDIGLGLGKEGEGAESKREKEGKKER
ncbi:MAG: hypothetical protein LQ342_007174 [Letrouitia transgressa]|nr:MAG: hypothetical protein LQ342_007174 [Letrouitia transgressa]